MLTLAIQAGGESRRMGEDKALKPFLGRPLIVHLLERLGGIAEEVLVTTNRPEAYAFLGVRLASDLVPGRGALGGLYTALAMARQPLVAVVACDMPFASREFFLQARQWMREGEWDVIVPRSEAGYEPLHALYRRETCLPAVKEALEAGAWRVITWFERVRVREVTEEEMRMIDPSGRAFWNVNTPEEFARAEEVGREEKGLG